MIQDQVTANLDHWKRKLLDLTKRNRLLNFKPSKVTTVMVVDELPAEVFKILAGRSRSMKFRPAEDPEDDTGEPGEDEALADFELFARPTAGAAAADRHVDMWLQTTLSAVKLDHNLRRIADQAESVLEEQGVGTLFLALGMLHWYEADDSDEVRRAPILLLPVKLTRKAAGTAYTVAAGDDEPVLNPALVEHLRASFNVRLPEMPEATEDYDPSGLLSEIAEAVRSLKRWKVTNEIALGLFSFQKFVMFKDLERNRAAFLAHRLIQQLATRKSGELFGLPADVAGMQLDQEFAPESTFQVVDADSSQLRAVAAVARGNDLVMQGPPGTGKSQTITNLISHALSEGKSVLFVSEKMAALQVVHGRLKAAGLGDFCLELHSGKANKRAFITEIARSLDNSLAVPVASDRGAGRLKVVRDELSAYAAALHAPEAPLGLTPFQAFGMLARHPGRATLQLRTSVDAVTMGELEEALRRLNELAAAASGIGDPARHPWRDSARGFYAADVQREVEDLLAAIIAACSTFIDAAPTVEAAFGLPKLSTAADGERLSAVASVMERSPGAAVEVLTSAAWNSPPSMADELIRIGERADSGTRAALGRFTPEVMDRDHAGDSAIIERLHRRPYRMLVGEYRRVRKAWLSSRLSGYSGTLGDQVPHMRAIDDTRGELAALDAAESGGRQLFGTLWRGRSSEWGELRHYVDWVVEFRSACVRHGLTEDAAKQAATPHPDVSALRAIAAHAKDIASHWAALAAIVSWPTGYLSDAPVADIRERAASMQADFSSYTGWAAFHKARLAARGSIAGEGLEAAELSGTGYASLPAAFEQAFLEKWLGAVVSRRPELVEFHSPAHEERLKEFKALDGGVLKRNRSSLAGRLRDRVQHQLLQQRGSEGLSFLRGQMARQRNHAALRSTLHKAHDAIKAIKSCFMMSPLTVAQFLDPEQHQFDLVIFDEASQLTAEDAVGAVVRGRQLVVVGDPKQLPPTNFFAAQSGQVEPERNEQGEPLVEDMESILEQFMAAGLPSTRLRWHYRSQHESLIAFSNVNFYDSELHTFPSADTDTRSRGLQFVYVEDGLYEGAGLNRSEARRVADAVVEFAREQLARPDSDRASLGVGTFNLRQQIAIQDELEGRRRQEPTLESFFAPRDEGAFFVKNLENIQGDDRDAIFLSVTYAKGLDGKLRHNFGPINGENGWRRLNVLTTRARLRLRVFSSIRSEDIDLTKTNAAGARYLKDYLRFAETGQLVGAATSVSAEADSPFEYEMFQELTRRGLRVVPQVGVAGYRVDLGVLDHQVEGRFICGIECDGAAYHSAESARDRDRLRQQVLEGLGWTIHRVWSTDWFKDREGTLTRLMHKIEAARLDACARRAAPSPAPPASAPDPVSPSSEPAFHERPIPVEKPAATDGLTLIPYVTAELGRRGGGHGVLETSTAELTRAVGAVVEVEAPIHRDDVMSRVALACGDQRVGPRIARALDAAIAASARRGTITVRGEFAYLPGAKVTPRCRAGTGIPADRIAPEEFQQAVLLVLGARAPVSRSELTTEVRTLFGFGRTGATLEALITAAVDRLLLTGVIGEASTGLALRAAGRPGA